MKIVKNRVMVSSEEVAEFNRHWPASRLQERSYLFEFDGGGLVNTDVPEEFDGPEAVALAEDCRIAKGKRDAVLR